MEQQSGSHNIVIEMFAMYHPSIRIVIQLTRVANGLHETR